MWNGALAGLTDGGDNEAEGGSGCICVIEKEKLRWEGLSDAHRNLGKSFTTDSKLCKG